METFETKILVLQKAMEGKDDVELSPSELIVFYRQMMNTYNKSLELIRKIMAYFPVVLSDEDKMLLSIFNDMSLEEKRELIKQLGTTNA